MARDMETALADLAACPSFLTRHLPAAGCELRFCVHNRLPGLRSHSRAALHCWARFSAGKRSTAGLQSTARLEVEGCGCGVAGGGGAARERALMLRGETQARRTFALRSRRPARLEIFDAAPPPRPVPPPRHAHATWPESSAEVPSQPQLLRFCCLLLVEGQRQCTSSLTRSPPGGPAPATRLPAEPST